MPEKRPRSLGAKVLLCSALGLLLSFGLCAFSNPVLIDEQPSATFFQRLIAGAGGWLFYLSLLGLFIGACLVGLAGLHEDDR